MRDLLFSSTTTKNHREYRPFVDRSGRTTSTLSFFPIHLLSHPDTLLGALERRARAFPAGGFNWDPGKTEEGEGGIWDPLFSSTTTTTTAAATLLRIPSLY